MNGPISKLARCAIYTRKSTEYNLELAFNSLDAQREACEAYIKSQAHEGWRLIPGRYDDGGPPARFILKKIRPRFPAKFGVRSSVDVCCHRSNMCCKSTI
jgi:hypothetical protein